MLGHSTGSQDVLHYLISDGERPKVDGGILQGAVSDREGMVMLMPPKEYDTIVKIAQEYIDNGRGDDCLPIALTGGVYPGACSASRWISIASPGPHHVGMDDYFSSDFSDERLTKTFGRVGLSKTPISILYGGQDQYVPTSIDKEALIQKWIRHVKEGGGVVDEDAGVIEGATHALKEGGKPLEELNRRIICFIERIGGF